MFLAQYLDKPLVIVGLHGDSFEFSTIEHAHDFIQKQGLTTFDFEYEYRYEKWQEILESTPH